MRGVSHQLACFVAAAAGLQLTASSATPYSRLASAIYSASLVMLFAASALYHRRNWGPKGQLRMQKIDHSCIFVLIAGTYTPICMLAMPDQGTLLLILVWGCAALGICQATLWPDPPRWFRVASYCTVGWLMVPFSADLVRGLGASGAVWVLAGGVAYTLGAMVYARRKPDPFPATFGYHEVFHVCVIIASMCHFSAISRLVHGSR